MKINKTGMIFGGVLWVLAGIILKGESLMTAGLVIFAIGVFVESDK